MRKILINIFFIIITGVLINPVIYAMQADPNGREDNSAIDTQSAMHEYLADTAARLQFEANIHHLDTGTAPLIIITNPATTSANNRSDAASSSGSGSLNRSGTDVFNPSAPNARRMPHHHTVPTPITTPNGSATVLNMSNSSDAGPHSRNTTAILHRSGSEVGNISASGSGLLASSSGSLNQTTRTPKAIDFRRGESFSNRDITDDVRQIVTSFTINVDPQNQHQRPYSLSIALQGIGVIPYGVHMNAEDITRTLINFMPQNNRNHITFLFICPTRDLIEDGEFQLAIVCMLKTVSPYHEQINLHVKDGTTFPAPALIRSNFQSQRNVHHHQPRTFIEPTDPHDQQYNPSTCSRYCGSVCYRIRKLFYANCSCCCYCCPDCCDPDKLDWDHQYGHKEW